MVYYIVYTIHHNASGQEISARNCLKKSNRMIIIILYLYYIFSVFYIYIIILSCCKFKNSFDF